VCLVLHGRSSHLLNQTVFNLEKSYEVTLEQEQECASKQENIMFLTHFSSRFGMHALILVVATFRQRSLETLNH
jgi:hypothetical protein